MRQHSNQVKSVTGHSLVWVFLCVVFAASFAFSSCNKGLLEDIVYPDRDYFGWTLEFEVNDEKVELESIFDPQGRLGLFKESWPDYQDFGFSCHLPFYSGHSWDKDNQHKIVFDYEMLSFNIMKAGLYLHIVGPGQGGFKENVVYSSPDDIVLYHPALLSDFANQTLNPHKGDDWDVIPTFNGFEVKLLSSSFKFNHSIKWRVGKVLNFYFDFVEVITAVPDEWKGTPSVGDTVRITNGHVVQMPGDMDEAAFE